MPDHHNAPATRSRRRATAPTGLHSTGPHATQPHAAPPRRAPRPPARSPHLAEPLEPRLFLADTAGHLDPSFGAAGRVLLEFPPFGPSETITALATFPDGGFALTGFAYDNAAPGPAAPTWDVLAYRFRPDGSPDPAFGTNGRLTLDLGHNEIMSAAAVLPDGRLVVGGFAHGPAVPNSNFTVVAFNPDGTPSPSFGSAGVLIDPTLGGITALAAQPDGKLLAAHEPGNAGGFSVARLTAAGTPDPAFGTGGSATVPLGAGARATSVAVQPGGKILLGGTHLPFGPGSTRVAIARLNPDGSPDSTFGAGGALPSAMGFAEHVQVAPAPGGDTVVLHDRYSGLPLGRFTDIGARHPTWPSWSDAWVDVADGAPFRSGLVVQADGRIIAAGSYQQSSNDRRLVLARFNPDGSRDTGFGTSGRIAANLPASVAGHAALLPDGNLLLAGAGGNRIWAERRLLTPTPPSPPVADPGGPLTVAEGTDWFALDGTDSFDGDTTITSWEWDLDYDGATFTPDATGARAGVSGRTLDGPSTRTVALRVTDATGASTIATTPLNVPNVAPPAVIGGPLSASEGAPYTLALSAAGDPGADTITHWTIDWGDGTPQQVVAGNPPSVTHVFADGPSVASPIRAWVTDEDDTYAASVGRRDATFGVQGWMRYPSGDFGPAAGLGALNAAAVLPDGSILAAGGLNTGGFTVIRIGPGGLIDQSFGANGVARPLPTMPGEARALAAQGDGKIVAAGTIDHATGSTPSLDWAILRFNANGSIDTTFGQGGRVTFGFGAADDAANGVVIQSDGKIVVAGKAGGKSMLLRLHPDGSIDNGFGPSGDGRVTGAFGETGDTAGSINDLLLLPDDKLLAAGAAGDDYALARFTAGGAPDDTFGAGAGRVRGRTATTVWQSITRIALTPGGQIVAAAEALQRATGAQEGAALRFNADGSPDASFGDGGAARTPAESVGGVAVDPSGRVLLAGSRGGQLGPGVLLTRFLPDGTPDAGFGAGGTLRPDYDSIRTFRVGRLLLQPDGRPVLVGAMTNSGAAFAARVEVLEQIRVDNVAPTLTLGGAGAALAEETFTLQLGRTDPGTETVSHWTVDWGDGTTARVDGPAAEARHTYAAAGIYTVTAQLTDEDGEYPAGPHVVRVIAPARLGADGTLTVSGSSIDDAIELTRAAGPAGDELVVTINWFAQRFPAADVARVNLQALGGADTVRVGPGVVGGTIDLGDGADRFTLDPGAAATPLTVLGGAGNDTFTLTQPAQTLTLDGGAGTDAVTVSGTAGDDVIVITADRLTQAGAADVLFGAVESIRLNPLAGTDRVRIDAAPGDPPQPPPALTVDLTGAGDDLVEIVASAAGQRIEFSFGQGADAARIGVGARGVFTLTGFRSVFPGGDDQVVWDASDGDDAITMTPWSGMGPTLSDAGRSLAISLVLGNLVVNGNGGADVFDFVQPPMPVTLDGGAGDDRFTVRSGDLSQAMVLTLRGGDGADALLVDDRVPVLPFSPGYIVSDAAVLTPMQTITLDAVEAVTIEGTPQADPFRFTPSDKVDFTLRGNNPATGTAVDRLALYLEGGPIPRLEPGASAGSGRYVFEGRRDLVFEGIETLPEFVPPEITGGVFLDTATPQIRATVTERLEVVLLRLVNVATGAVRTVNSAAYNAAAGTHTFSISSLNLPDGDYRAELRAAEQADFSGNRPVSDFVLPFRLIRAPHVAGRHVFYNASALDGQTAGADARDDAAIAADKRALLPGETGSSANVTSYDKGINGVMVDLARQPANRTLTLADFEFRTGAAGNPAAWRTAANPTMTFVRGTGINGTDRVTFVWPAGAFRNTWLRVTVKANVNTGLTTPDVFYFGNLVGDAGGPGTPTVNATDLAGTRAAAGSTTPARLRQYDFNRDNVINAADVLIARTNQRRTLPLPTTAPPAAAAPAPAPTTRDSTRPPRRSVLGEQSNDLLT